MNCDDAQVRLADFFDQALDAATTKDMEEHLASCPRCAAEAEQLAGCLRQVASLETVDPPLGFSERVMARVREIESKRSLWHRLLFPLSIKLPLHATAVVLIGIMALYLLKRVPSGEEARLATEPAFGRLKQKKEGEVPGSHREIGGAAAKNETLMETPASNVRAPASERQPKVLDQTKELPASREESTAFEDRQGLEGKPVGPHSFAAPKKSILGAEEASGTGAKSPAEKPRPGVAPAAPELKGRATATESAASIPSSRDAVSDSRAASAPAASGVPGQLEIASDLELVVRRARQSGAQQRDSLATLGKSKERESPPPREAAERLAPLLPVIPESAKPQEFWLTITRAQYDQLKRELLAVGALESESWLSSREKDSAFRADDRLRIKVTVLPPEP